MAALDQAVSLAELAEHPVLSDLATRLESTVDTGLPPTTIPVLPRAATPTATPTPEPAATRRCGVGRKAGRGAGREGAAGDGDRDGDPAGRAAAEWAAEHRDDLHAIVAEHGAVLVRGLRVATVDDVGAVSRHLVGDPVEEREGFATRHRHGPGLYSSAEWPSVDPMCMHHELSYTVAVPCLLLFGCLTAPRQGGATALADGAAMLRALPDDLVDRVVREGWQLRRAYNGDVGMRWQAAFGTDDRAEAEAYGRHNGIGFEWGGRGELVTRQRRTGVVTHQDRRVWFNQIAFLNEWTMAPELRRFLTEVFGRDRLPFNTSFGDGDPVGQAVVDTILDRYEKLTVREPWQDGDVLLVDNLRMAHSREAYDGRREVVVAMGSPLELPGHRL